MLVSPAMMYVFLLSAKRLYESLGQKLNFDQFVLMVESLKLLIYLIFSFCVFHQSMMIYVQILQTSIQFCICLSFITKVFNISGHRRLEKFIIGMFAAAFVCVILCCIVMTHTPHFLNCKDSTFGKVWVLLTSCGVVQSILIAASSCYLKNTMKRRADLLK
jgi:hypothetical protein